MKTIHFFLMAIITALFIIPSCKDDTPDCDVKTYESGVKTIIDAGCAYSGCHSGADAGMWVPDGSKDYTNYEGLLATINDGSFYSRVIDSLDMPPHYAQDPHPKELTPVQLEIMECWLNNEFPKN